MIMKPIVAALVTLLAVAPAFAQHVSLTTAAGAGIKCADFTKNADGSWTPLVDMIEKGSAGTKSLAAKTSVIRPGDTFSGIDVAAALTQQCH
jgi:hypothetical protein